MHTRESTFPARQQKIDSKRKVFKPIFHQKACGWKTNSDEHSREDAKTPAIERTRNFSCFHTRRGDLIELWRGWRSRTFRYRKWMLTVVSGKQHESTLKNWNFKTSRCAYILRFTRPRIDGRNSAKKLKNKLKRDGDWQKLKLSSSLYEINFCNLISAPDTSCIFVHSSLIINSSLVRN